MDSCANRTRSEQSGWNTWRERQKRRRRDSKRKLEEITKTTFAAAMKDDFIKDRTDLTTTRITDIITNPNKKWKEAKKDHEIPSDYFAASASGD